MVPRFRPTMWRRCTTQQYVELTMWQECTRDSWGPTRNDARARLLKVTANRYWPRKAIVTAWLREHWEEWEHPATRPTWFTNRWRSMFPPGWLPATSFAAAPSCPASQASPAGHSTSAAVHKVSPQQTNAVTVHARRQSQLPSRG